MIISVKISLKEATEIKKRKLHALLIRTRGLINKYTKSLWDERGKLDKATMDRIPCNYLSYRHRANCLKVALETVIATRKSAKALKRRASCPKPPHTVRLSSLVCQIEENKRTFDYIIKISGLTSGSPIVIPFYSHKVLNKWLKRGGKILQGASINEDFACLWIEVPDKDMKTSGGLLAVDAGINKLLVDSEGNHYGKDCKTILDKVRRKKPGSKGKARAVVERKCYMNHIVKQLPWDKIAVVAHEDLRNIKKGKKKNRGRSFRKLLAPWTIRQVFTRIKQIAQQNRVRVVVVDPKYTSQKCPSCLTVSVENRKGEVFKCINCGHKQDADEVGAINIFNKALETLGSLWSPRKQNPICHSFG
jgi:IS605 OrfB family transposase